jgi:Uma2 family endonuclease
VQGPFAASEDSEPEPDLAVYPLQSYAHEHPSQALLVIEVADSSLPKDRRIKAPLYAAAGVPEYWIVDVVGRTFEIHSAPDNGRYTRMLRLTPGETIAVAAFPDVTVDVASILSPA